MNRKRKVNKAAWLCAALLALTLGTGSTPGLAQVQQEVGLRMDVDKRELQVGDRITLTIEFRQMGNGGSSEFQAPSIHTPENFEIQGTFSAARVIIENQQTVQISTTKLSLKATRPGAETLGPAVLIFKDAQQQTREIKSNIITVTVTEKKSFSIFGHKKKKENANPPQANNPVATPDEPLRDIKPLVPESSSPLKVIFWLVVAVLLAGFIWRHFQNKGPRVVVPAIPEKAAQLREAWRKLADDELTAKEFCLGLANLTRECLEFRFRFPAVDLTTEEILMEAGKHKLTAEELDAVEKCLKATDRVLYADGNLTGRDNLRTYCSSLLPRIQKK